MPKIAEIYEHKPWLAHYDRHVPATLDYPNSSLVDLFEHIARNNPNQPFILYKNQTFTYQQVNQQIENLSKSLIKSGLEKGERAALILPNIPQFVTAYFAILKAGGVVAAMNPNYKQPEFEFLFTDCKPRKAICLPKHIPVLNEIGFPLEDIIQVRQNPKSSKLHLSKTSGKISDFEDLCQTGLKIEGVQFPEISPDNPAIFQYSGGTTGVPKAAIGSHRNIAANITQFKIWCALEDRNETILAVIPLYHVYGMVLTMNLAVASQSRVVLVDDPTDIEEILKEIENRKVTFYPGVPTMFYSINRNPRVKAGEFDITSIKACISGSAPLNPQIKDDFERLTGGKLVEGYGLSEAPTATHCNPIFGINKAGSIGLPLPDVSCKVVDLNKGDKAIPIGEPGELALKGPQVMSGYYNQPEEGKIALRDGWLYTGDVVRMDDDGYFFIVDRKKSLIKVSGFQVWPNEIEQVIASHPEVAECAAGGVPDIKQGEKVIAWVVREPNSIVDAQMIKNWCRKRMVNYKVPSEIYFIDHLPRSGVGKVLRRELIREYKEDISPIETKTNKIVG